MPSFEEERARFIREDLLTQKVDKEWQSHREEYTKLKRERLFDELWKRLTLAVFHHIRAKSRYAKSVNDEYKEYFQEELFAFILDIEAPKRVDRSRLLKTLQCKMTISQKSFWEIFVSSS